MPVKNQVTKNKSRVIASEAKQSKKEIATGSSNPRNDNLTVPVYSLAGKTSTTLSLPKEIFGAKVNKALLSQAVRVYTTNEKTFTASTKGRGEVEGSTVKIFRQKGTGRARHGSIRAPIFVGGGIVFGPKPRKVRLNMPQKMKKAALFSALSSKAGDGNVLGLTGLDKATGKTKEVAGLLRKIFDKKIKSALILTESKSANVLRAVSNIPQVDVLPVGLANAYEVLRHEMLLLTKEALDQLNKKESKVNSLESNEEKVSKVSKAKRKEKISTWTQATSH